MKKIVIKKNHAINICVLMMVLCLFTVFGCSNQSKDIHSSDSAQIQRSKEETTKKTENLENKNIDLTNDFKNINGCAVIFTPHDNQYLFYNEDMCKQRVSPYSTFKIISTLIGLRNGVIDDETSVMNYNGTKYPVADWNSNLSLQEAFQSSCIWYFRQIIDSVGEDEVKNELNHLIYGNCDISEWNGSSINSIKELNGFWLDSSLKISPLEQIQVLSRIFEGQSIYDAEDVDVLQNIMLVENIGAKKIYGKTGSSTNGEAWFIGFSEENSQKVYFVIYLSDGSQPKGVSGTTAKEIALEIIK